MEMPKVLSKRMTRLLLCSWLRIDALCFTMFLEKIEDVVHITFVEVEIFQDIVH